MEALAIKSLLSSGYYCIIDSSASNRGILANHLRSLEPKVQIAEYPNISTCLESWKTLVKPKDVKCVFLDRSEGSKKCVEFLDVCFQLNSRMFVVATGQDMPADDLRSLISSGVSQVLLRPFDENSLSKKLISADQFQRKLVEESEIIPSINEFGAQVERISGQVYVIHFSGWITGNSELPNILPDLSSAKIFIDCEGLSGLNSVGVRKWLFWIRDLEKNGFTAFEFENVHSRVLSHINTLAGFKPSSGFVNSFYLTYDNDRINLEKEFKFRRDQDFDGETMVLPQLIEILHSGQTVPLSIDPLFKSQIAFYKGNIKLVSVGRKKAEQS